MRAVTILTAAIGLLVPAFLGHHGHDRVEQLRAYAGKVGAHPGGQVHVRTVPLAGEAGHLGEPCHTPSRCS